ncbi:uncharacterized protein MELLADRAFT_69140 [Melampsora larici-populina 98AG31]|uniref:Uncharacterized protein n=1 Tax=Melampsora larici-populina (strain 98AG31 / pathotype 3-4-7) TaxID=747676 RepID=F4S9J4_MELLP|nr:uncharacterized protein MELLADRAFT_69140 [Melampsora larici-populina 98AG31]EGF98690.1 hypothetical protein MELLADRAFT_69140 [Melampsora larici-populina 98AG31]
MDQVQKDKLISSNNKLHQMHLEAEEKRRAQAEKERMQAEDRARRAESRAPASTQPPREALVDVNDADNDGDPIDPTGTAGGSGEANGEEGDDESSEAEENGTFKSALKKKIQMRQDGSLVPSLEKSIRIKVPSSVEVDKEPQQGASIMDELNHAVEFGTLEEAKAALEKVDAILKRSTLFNPPRNRPEAVAPGHARRPGVVQTPNSHAKADRAPAQAKANKALAPNPKRKISRDSENPSSSSSSSDDSKLKKKLKKCSKSKKKKSRKSSDPDLGDSTPSESSSSDDSSAVKVSGRDLWVFLLPISFTHLNPASARLSNF